MFARVSAGGTAAWYLQDREGSVRYLVDNTGAVHDHLTYDGYGNVLTESSPTFGDRFKYTGREFDGETGLQYNRARYYDPKTGRWTSQDPMGFASGDFNKYRYVHNSPMDSNDPLGLDKVTIAIRPVRGNPVQRGAYSIGVNHPIVVVRNDDGSFTTYDYYPAWNRNHSRDPIILIDLEDQTELPGIEGRDLEAVFPMRKARDADKYHWCWYNCQDASAKLVKDARQNHLRDLYTIPIVYPLNRPILNPNYPLEAALTFRPIDAILWGDPQEDPFSIGRYGNNPFPFWPPPNGR